MSNSVKLFHFLESCGKELKVEHASKVPILRQEESPRSERVGSPFLLICLRRASDVSNEAIASMVCYVHRIRRKEANNFLKQCVSVDTVIRVTLTEI